MEKRWFLLGLVLGVLFSIVGSIWVTYLFRFSDEVVSAQIPFYIASVVLFITLGFLIYLVYRIRN